MFWQDKSDRRRYPHAHPNILLTAGRKPFNGYPSKLKKLLITNRSFCIGDGFRAVLSLNCKDTRGPEPRIRAGIALYAYAGCDFFHQYNCLYNNAITSCIPNYALAPLPLIGRFRGPAQPGKAIQLVNKQKVSFFLLSWRSESHRTLSEPSSTSLFLNAISFNCPREYLSPRETSCRRS